jgi:hypothetical protein
MRTECTGCDCVLDFRGHFDSAHVFEESAPRPSSLAVDAIGSAFGKSVEAVPRRRGQSLFEIKTITVGRKSLAVSPHVPARLRANKGRGLFSTAM